MRMKTEEQALQGQRTRISAVDAKLELHQIGVQRRSIFVLRPVKRRAKSEKRALERELVGNSRGKGALKPSPNIELAFRGLNLIRTLREGSLHLAFCLIEARTFCNSPTTTLLMGRGQGKARDVESTPIAVWVASSIVG